MLTIKEIIETLGEEASYAFLVGKCVVCADYYDQGGMVFVYHLALTNMDTKCIIVTVPSDLPKYCLSGLYMNDQVECDVLDLFALEGP